MDLKHCVILSSTENKWCVPPFQKLPTLCVLRSPSTFRTCSTRQVVFQIEAAPLKWEHIILSFALCQPLGLIRYEQRCQVKKVFVKG